MSSNPARTEYQCPIHGDINLNELSSLDPRMVTGNSPIPGCICIQIRESYIFHHENATPTALLSLRGSFHPPEPRLTFPPTVDLNQTYPASTICSWRGMMMAVNALREAAPNGNAFIIYRCKWDSQNHPCNLWIEGSRKAVGKHLNTKHGVSTTDKNNMRCLWDSCTDTVRGENMARHVMSRVHLDAKVQCLGCDGQYARGDSYQRHAESSQSCYIAGSRPLPGQSGQIVPSNAEFLLDPPSQ